MLAGLRRNIARRAPLPQRLARHGQPHLLLPGEARVMARPDAWRGTTPTRGPPCAAPSHISLEPRRVGLP
jgi:hypothetical protein